MSSIYVSADIINENQMERATFKVDTGAHFSVVPADVLRRMGVSPAAECPVTFADGRKANWDMATVSLRLFNESLHVPVLFGDAKDRFLLGVTALEIFRAVADPIHQRIVRVESVEV